MASGFEEFKKPPQGWLMELVNSATSRWLYGSTCYCISGRAFVRYINLHLRLAFTFTLASWRRLRRRMRYELAMLLSNCLAPRTSPSSVVSLLQVVGHYRRPAAASPQAWLYKESHKLRSQDLRNRWAPQLRVGTTPPQQSICICSVDAVEVYLPFTRAFLFGVHWMTWVCWASEFF